MATVCTTCQAPHHDMSFLCPNCTNTLRNRLRDVPGSINELQVTKERRDKTSAPSMGGGSGERSLPVNFRAADASTRIRRLVMVAAVKLCHQLHTDWEAHCAHLNRVWRDRLVTDPDAPAPDLPPEPLLPSLNTGKYALWLIRHTAQLRRYSYAPDLLQNLTEAIRDAGRVIDTAPVKVFAGHCPTETEHGECGNQLMANPDTDQVACRKCLAVWDVTDWRNRALDAAETLTGQAAEISRALKDPFTGENLPSATIRSWAHRGLLTAVNEAIVTASAAQGVRVPRLYRVGDVRTVWAAQIAAHYRPKSA